MSSTVSDETVVVFITGANTGIGYEVTKQLSRPGVYKPHKYHIVIGALVLQDGLDAVSQLLEEEPSRSVSAVQIDVTNDSSIASAITHIDTTFGRLDILVNNAGVLLDGLDTTSAPRALFERTFQVNVFGAAAVTEACEPLLAKSTALAGRHIRSPHIIFMSSRLGSLSVKADATDRSAARHFPVYRSSKCALNMLMLHYANVYRPRGWRVNSCDPGLTATALAGNQQNMGTVEDGARNCLRLATSAGSGKEDESGTFTNTGGSIPW